MALEIFRLVGSVFVDTDEANKSLQKTDQNAENFGNTLLEGVKTAAKWAAGIAAAAGTAATALAVSSVKSYAEYEQLIGGVETLFKDSAGTILEYAEGAYKTAGMTANKYMETVTGFSASLLQSLDGDTAAAAEYAHQAIVDMSDNANKMGTSMESIVSAYQGFAKQNYSMLDNLKLGYGGTQAEMYRLMEDAKALGAEFNSAFYITDKGQLVADFADITTAIHTIQTEMGITGTTAKEAEGTISGSISMITSRLENFKNVIGAALAPVVKEFLGFVVAQLPAVENAVNQLATVWIPGLIAAISDCATWIQDNGDKIVEWTGYIVAAGVGVGTFLLYLNWGQIMSAASAALNLVTAAIKKMNTTMKSNPIGLVISLIAALITYLGYLYTTNDEFRAFVDEMLSALWAKLQVVIEWFKANVLPTIQEAIAWIQATALPAIQEVLAVAWEKLQEFIAWFKDTALPVIQEVLAAAWEKLQEFVAWYVANVLPAIQEAIVWIQENVLPVVQEILAAAWEKLQEFVAWYVANVLPAIQAAIIWIRDNVLPIVLDVLAKAWDNLQAFIAWFLENILPAIQALFVWIQEKAIPVLVSMMDWINQNIMPVISALVSWLGETLGKFWGWLSETIGAFWDWLTSSFESTGDDVGGIWDKITGFFKSAWDFIVGIWEACQPFFQGIWEGVVQPVWGLLQEMWGAFQMAWDVIKLVWDYVEPYFLGIWEGIKAAFSVIGEVLGAYFSVAWEGIKLVWNMVGPYFSAIWETIKAVFSVVVEYLGGFFRTAWEVIKAVWDVVISYFTLVWAGIKAVFAVVKGVLSGDFSDAWDAIKNVWEKAKNFFTSVWNGIKNVFGSVGKWFGDTFKAAWDAIKKVFDGWGRFFSSLWDNIKTTFSNLGTKIGSAIGDAVKAGINGVIGMIEGTINGFIGLINGAVNLINLIPGVNLGKISELSFPRLEKGGVLEKGQVGLLEGNGAEAVVPLHQNKKWISAVARDMEGTIGGTGNDQVLAVLMDIQSLVETKLEAMLDALWANQSIEMNKREFARLVKAVE